MRAIMAGKMGNGKVAATVGRPMAVVGANHLAIHVEEPKVKAGQISRGTFGENMWIAV